MKALLTIFILLVAPVAVAQLSESAGSASYSEVTIEQNLRSLMQQHFPNKEIVSVDAIGEGVLYQVSFASGLTLYSLANGEYFVAGNIFQATDTGVVNLSKQLKQQQRAQLLSELKPNEYLALKPLLDEVKEVTGEPEAQGSLDGAESLVDSDEDFPEPTSSPVLYVIVDVDCYYCQFQHQESAQLVAAGIEVRYLSYNRQKPGSSAYHKVRRTWCSDEPQAALDMLMQGRSLAENQCTAGLMERHTALVKTLGIKRLPAVVTEDGRLTEGLLRAPQIFNLLGVEPPLASVIESPTEPAEAQGQQDLLGSGSLDVQTQ